MKIIDLSERSKFHKSWVMLDKSVVVQGLPDFCGRDTFHQVPTFGDLKVGLSPCTNQRIDSIQIKLFGLEKHWVFDTCDAFVCITLTDAEGTTRVRGFHADVHHTCLDKVNNMLFVRKKIRYMDPDGSCPICLETDMKLLHPMQAANSRCGHGVCQKCFMTSQDECSPKCPLCREPVPRRFDHLSEDELHAVCEYARGGGGHEFRRRMEVQAYYRMRAGEPTYSVMSYY